MLALRPSAAAPVRRLGRAPRAPPCSRRRSRSSRACAAGDGAAREEPPAGGALAARVLASLQASAAGAGRSRVALLDAASLAPDVVFSDEFGTTLRGREAYASAAERWAAAHGAELGTELRWRPLRCAATGPEQLVVQWEATWVPEAMAPLVRFGRGVGWAVSFYDLLDRVGVASAFSWRAAFTLLARAAATRKLPLPHACIRGTAVLTFAAAGDTRSEGDGHASPPLLLRHVERLELTPVFAAGRARNRRVTRDLLSFLETGRRPPGTPPQDWDATLAERLRVRDVPGMGQFDVDGLTSEDRGRFLDDVSAVLGFATIVVLTFGVAAAALLADERQRSAPLGPLDGDDDTEGEQRGGGVLMRRRRLLARAARADGAR